MYFTGFGGFKNEHLRSKADYAAIIAKEVLKNGKISLLGLYVSKTRDRPFLRKKAYI